MQHKACFEAVNRTLNDVCNSGNQQLFGGIPTVLRGDFAQILPVIRRGTRQSTVLASIQHWSIWPHLQILKLKTSMRMMASEVNQVFVTFLRDMVTNPLHYGNLHLCNMCTCSGNGTQERAVQDLLCLVDLYLVYLI